MRAANLCCVAATFFFSLATTGTAQELVLNKVEFGQYTDAGLDQLAAGMPRMFVSGQSFVVSVNAASVGTMNLWHIDHRVRKVRSVNLVAETTKNSYYTIPFGPLSRGFMVVEFASDGVAELDASAVHEWARINLEPCDVSTIAFHEGTCRGTRLIGCAFLQGDYLIGDKSQVPHDNLIRFYAKSRWYSGQALTLQGRYLDALAAFDEARRALKDCFPIRGFDQNLTYAAAVDSITAAIQAREPEVALRYFALAEAANCGRSDTDPGLTEAKLLVKHAEILSLEGRFCEADLRLTDLIARSHQLKSESGKAGSATLGLAHHARYTARLSKGRVEAALRDLDEAISLFAEAGDRDLQLDAMLNRVARQLDCGIISLDEARVGLDGMLSDVSMASDRVKSHYWRVLANTCTVANPTQAKHLSSALELLDSISGGDEYILLLIELWEAARSCRLHGIANTARSRLFALDKEGARMTRYDRARLNLAIGKILAASGDFGRSLERFRFAREQLIGREGGRVESSTLIEIQLSIADVHFVMGDYVAAGSVLDSANQEANESVDWLHLAQVSFQRARLELLQGNYDAAVEHLELVAAKQNGSRFGREWHYASLQRGFQLAICYLFLDQPEAARRELALAVSKADAWVEQLAQASGERHLLAMQGELLRWLDQLVYATYKLGKDDFDLWLVASRLQGQVWSALAARPAAREARGASGVRARELQRIRFQLANAVLYGPRIGEYDVEQLAQRKEELEIELANSQPADVLGADRWRPSGTTAILDTGPRPAPGEVLVQFLAFGDSPQPLQRRYCALVIPAAGEITRVDLGQAVRLEEAIAHWRRDIQEGRDDVPRARQVGAMLWRPLARHLPSGVETILLRPEHALCAVPWAAVVDPHSNRRLLQDYTLVLSMGPPRGDVLPTALPAPPSGPLLLVGDVDYARTSGPSLELTEVHRAAQERDWAPLPSTAAELDRIAATCRGKVTQLRGAAATPEAVLRAMNEASIVHIASHGFFAQDAYMSALQADRELGAALGVNRARSAVVGRHPLTLSGLILAEGERSRLLSAEMIAATKLRPIDLVVLSACDTGLGDTAGGEGILGLHRAFHLSGVQSVVGTLWKVDDRATMKLMQDFYRNLWRDGMSAPQALRQAQLTMLGKAATSESGRGPKRVTRVAQPAPQGPAVANWAGFVLSHCTAAPSPPR